MLLNIPQLASVLFLLLPSTLAVPAPSPADLTTNLAANTTIAQGDDHPYKKCTLRLLGEWPSEEASDVDFVWWNTYYIYDDQGKVVGRRVRLKQGISRGSSLLSTLPYTVEIRHLDRKGDYNSIKFNYAGFSYRGYFDCRRYFINNAPWYVGFYNDCSHEFDCGYT